MYFTCCQYTLKPFKTWPIFAMTLCIDLTVKKNKIREANYNGILGFQTFNKYFYA